MWSFMGRNLAANTTLLMRPTTTSFLFQGIITRGMAKSTLKTNRSAAKRFRVRGNGQIMRSKSGRSHNTGYKTPKRKSGLAQSTTINGKAIEKRMRRLIGA